VTPRQPRTHCDRGHPLTPENTYVSPEGGRKCRTCALRRDRAKNRKLMAARRRASALRKCVICGKRLPPGLRTDARICRDPECARLRKRGYWRRKHGKRQDP
jgi:hypothetical protein